MQGRYGRVAYERSRQTSKVISSRHSDSLLNPHTRGCKRPSKLTTHVGFWITLVRQIPTLRGPLVNTSFIANVKLPSEEVLHEDASLKLSLQYMPLGVIGAIVPWNFPLVLAMAKVAAALAAGNTVIVKPSPYTPYSILKVAELAIPILPRGVFQAINGDDTTGPEMTLHPDINKISFTGSTRAGKHILAATSNTLKECTLELGGNDPAIIFPDVDIHAVAQQVALGAFFNSGQFCLGSKRLYVHETIYNEFRDALVDVVKTWKVGPVDEDVMLGPIQNEMQFNVVTDIFKDCKANGYTFALEGGPSNGPGYIFHPTIVDRPPDGSRIVTEEPFGT